jgi:hypothetical protein
VIGRRDYAERRAARIERLEARAAKARADGGAAISRASSMASVIPFGQPVQYSHHSTRRDLNYRARIDATFDRGFRRLNEAKEIERRAESAALNGAISSDDPEALEKLRAELATEQTFHARWKAINAAVRSGKPERLDGLQLTPAEASRLRNSLCGTAYVLTNATARIRRVKVRIAELEAKAAAPARADEQIGTATVSESDNRVQIQFPGKPPEAVRIALKRASFRWAPSVGAWQRHASEQAWRAAREILGASA